MASINQTGINWTHYFVLISVVYNSLYSDQCDRHNTIISSSWLKSNILGQAYIYVLQRYMYYRDIYMHYRDEMAQLDPRKDPPWQDKKEED